MPEPLSYASLGVRSVINAAATLTALGGSVIPDEVVDAMRMAASSHVDMHELQAAVGTELARLTHNEAGYVSAGAAAGLTLSVLACATKGDPAAISQMPGGHGLPTEVVMHCGHRIPYDRAVELAGGRIVQIGNAIQTFGWELEAVLGANTAMVLWVAGSHLSAGTLDLAETVRIAHARGIPVVVDAAAQLPPVENLWAFTQAGADLALFSGGKALRGPQADWSRAGQGNPDRGDPRKRGASSAAGKSDEGREGRDAGTAGGRSALPGHRPPGAAVCLGGDRRAVVGGAQQAARGNGRTCVPERGGSALSPAARRCGRCPGRRAPALT